MKRDVDKGSSCLRPLPDLKKSCLLLLTSIVYQLLEINLKIRSVHDSAKPNFLSMKHRNGQETLTYSLVLSNLITIIALPFTKPLWFWLIILGRIPPSLALRSLTIILLDILQRLMILMSEKIWGHSFLRSMITQVWVKNLGKVAPRKKKVMALCKSLTIIFQALW